MVVLLLACAYVLGSIPFGVLIAKSKGVDLRKIGSGNIGATNVKRALGPRLAYTVFLLDVAKGALPATIARLMLHQKVGPFDPQTFAMIVGIAAVLGHCVSPFLGFRGGKGVSTTLGAVVGAAPVVAIIGFAEFLIIVSACRYVSLASLICVWSTLVSTMVLAGQSTQMVPVYLALSLFITVKHRANIKRLLAGTEAKFSFGQSEPPSATSNPSDGPPTGT